MRSLTLETLVAAQTELGEGPNWDSRDDSLTFVDVNAGRLHRLDHSGSHTILVDLGRPLGAALPSSVTGEYLLIARDGFNVLRGDGMIKSILDVLSDRPDLRFNDAKCDPVGRCFAGTLSLVDAPSSASLYRLDDGPQVKAVLCEVGLANGLGWAPGGDLLYFADTLAGHVVSFPYDVNSGELGEPRRFVEIPMPDGLCVDDDGGVWVAQWGGYRVSRFSPRGVFDTIVEVPTPNPTSCAFAGDSLIITSARAGMSRLDCQRFPRSGDVFIARPGVSGPPVTPWVPVARA